MPAMTEKMQTFPVDPRTGYDQAASMYDAWHWQAFWRRNEAPEIERVLRGLPQGRVLDAGTGTGSYLALAGKIGHEAYGLDVSERMLEEAARRLGDATGAKRLRQGDVCAMPFGENDRFDVVLCCRVLSHVEDPRQALSEMYRVLGKGGLAIITDVDGRHCYEATRIPIAPGRSVRIRVHKHTLERMVEDARAVGFSIREAALITVSDLAWMPERRAYPTIDWSGTTPLAYRIVLQRSSP